MNAIKIITMLSITALSIVGITLGLAEIQLNKQRSLMLKQETIYLTKINEEVEASYMTEEYNKSMKKERK